MESKIIIPSKLKRKPFDIKPYIVAIEGPNGVGKSTVCKEINKLKEFEYRLGVPKQWMEYNIKKRMIFQASWVASALYFMSGTMEVKREIEDINDKIIIMDRSVWSTLAVNWIKDPQRCEKIIRIMNEGHEFLPMPDMVIVLKADYEICQQRINNKIDEGKDFDKDSREEFIKEMSFYDWLNEQLDNVEIVDTSNFKPEDTLNTVKNIITNNLERKELLCI